MPTSCPLTALAHRLLAECDGDFVAARERICNIELCHISNDTTGLVDIFDRLAPSYGAQDVASQAGCLIRSFGADATIRAAFLGSLPFPRKGLSEAVEQQLAYVRGCKAVRR